MNYVLSVVRPPEGGAAFGTATVLDPVHDFGAFATALTHELTGTERVHTGTGLTFRIDHADRAPNACGCCGRLVLPSDHALAGSDDAHCLGCYTWSSNNIGCDPHHTAHPNPWKQESTGARFSMEIVIDRGDETDYDIRYAADDSFDGVWDEMENALIAWPGLRRDQITSVEIKEIL
jgi:hypothetical protein